MILDGKQIASDILKEVRTSLREGTHPLVRAVTIAPSAATRSYLQTKRTRAEEAGMILEVVEVSPSATEEELVAAIQKEGAQAVIVQLPLPDGISTEAAVNAIHVAQDADVLSDAAYARFEKGEEGALLPPVVGAIQELLKRADVSIAGKHVVVVGEGKLVGKPSAIWLARMGATVTTLTRSSGGMEQLLDADIIVSGAGQAGLITPDMIKEGVVVIDAGTSESNGSIAGDVDPLCAEKASVFTPVPGGVGPVAVACLFKNTALLLK